SRAGRIAARLSAPLDQPSRMVLRRLTRQPGRMAGAVMGIGAGMALSVAMIAIFDGFDTALESTFGVIDRSDISVTFTHPMSDKTIFELQRMRGVIEAEPVRIVPAVLHNGPNSYRGAVNGLERDARLFRAVDGESRQIAMPRDGILLTPALAGILKTGPGETLNVEVREGRRPILSLPVAGVAETLLGSPAYMQMSALNRALKEPGRVSAAFLRIDSAHQNDILRALKKMPSVAGVSRKEDARAAVQKMMDSGAGAVRYVMAAIAAVITFGIVYNAARIASAERARDLASLRVLGFTKGETAFVLLGELAAVTLLALPLGALLGHYLTFLVAEGFSTDLYQIPVVFSPESYGTAAVAVIVAALASGWLVKRDIDRADLISALKTRE
ncbi:MAG: FtsX-like permease family protein, partial [Paracoccaceae bacterium]